MANTVLNPSVIARAALATLYENAVLAGLVYRDYDRDFSGQVGDTITVRKPSVFDAKVFNRTNGIEIQNIGETGIPVKLDTLLDVSVAVTDEEMTMKIDDFAVQVLAPAMSAINQGIDSRIATAFNGAAGVPSVAVTKADQLVDVATALNTAKVPFADRAAVFSASLGGKLTKDPLFHQADQRGDTQGLREASIGRKFGFDTYLDQNFATGGVAFHKTALALVSRTLQLPKGGVQSATESYGGFGVRVIYGYDQNHKQQILSIDTLIGLKVLDPNRAVKITES